MKRELDQMSERVAALEEGNSLSLKTKLGSLKASGPVAVIIGCVILGTAFIAYMIRDHDLRNVDRAADIKASQREIIVGQRQVVESLDANTYVLLLSETERRALKMDMPDSLRRKIKDPR